MFPAAARLHLHGLPHIFPLPASHVALQRETQYHEMAALNDNLQFEPDMPA